jgi:hypothetical protein
MTAFSDYLENALLNGTLRNTATGGGYASGLAAVFVGLHTANPGEVDPTTSEVTGGSYARTAITFGAPVAGSSSNDALVTFPTATASWLTVTHFAIYNAATLGNELYWGALTVNKTVDSGDIFTIPIGNLAVTLQ